MMIIKECEDIKTYHLDKIRVALGVNRVILDYNLKDFYDSIKDKNRAMGLGFMICEKYLGSIAFLYVFIYFSVLIKVLKICAKIKNPRHLLSKHFLLVQL